MPLICQFLDSETNTFRVCTAEQLQLRQVSDGVAALGFVEPRQKRSDDGTTLLGPDGKPELEGVFVPVINYAINLVKPEEKPKIELAESVPASLTKKAKKSRG